MNRRIALLLGAFLGLTLVLAALYWFTSSPAPSRASRIDPFTQDEARVTLKLFHATWCPHCVNYLHPKDGSKPVWTSTLPAALKAKGLQGVRLEELEYDSNKEAADKYHVNSFPTIIGENQRGVVKKFEGDRNNVDELIAFASGLM